MENVRKLSRKAPPLNSSCRRRGTQLSTTRRARFRAAAAARARDKPSSPLRLRVRAGTDSQRGSIATVGRQPGYRDLELFRVQRRDASRLTL